jgi:hypothetical protein
LGRIDGVLPAGHDIVVDAVLDIGRLVRATVFSPGLCGKEGFGWSGHHIQVLRNHRVGSTARLAVFGPRLATLIRIRMSVGAAFAYSTKTSK